MQKIVNSPGNSGYSVNFPLIILVKRSVAGHPSRLKEMQLEKFLEVSHLSKTLGHIMLIFLFTYTIRSYPRMNSSIDLLFISLSYPLFYAFDLKRSEVKKSEVLTWTTGELAAL